MATLIGDLIEVFEKQILLYDDLLAISNEKKHVIIKNDMETLTTMNTVENSIISKINRLEKQRLVIIKDICDVLSLNVNNFTLSELANSLNIEEDKQAVLEIRDKLNKIILELNTVNELNKTLIESSLEYINFSLNSIRSAQAPMATGYEDDIKGKK